MPKKVSASICLYCLALTFSIFGATPTENLGIRVLPAPGPVVIDGRSDDWDMSGGIFACNDVESQRATAGLWIHMMFDAANLNVLAHFMDDTPLNNPGQTIGDYGFNGDSLQLRFQMDPGAEQGRISHWTCWRGRDGKDVMDVVYGMKFDQGAIKDAKTQGAQQAFARDADGHGYIQELAIPWKLLTRDGAPVRAGERFVVTTESNFTVGTSGRLSVKDIFKPGITIDRVFTFQGPGSWGWASCEARGNVAPQAVRLADGREFPVRIEKGAPAGLVVDWSALSQDRQSLGFKPLTFNLPADGFVSLNILSGDGAVVRQLLTATPFTKGEHTVLWDGLTTPSAAVPGSAVAPGAYDYRAIWHTGIGLRFRGWACNGGSAPWDGATGRENWGGDHGLPSDCAADGARVFLAWSSAEAGKALVACDLQGHVLWRNNRLGIAAASSLAADNNLVYAVNNAPDGSDYIYRLNAADGAYVAWPGADSPDLFPKQIWPDAKIQPGKIGGLAARDGKLYISFPDQNRVLVVDTASGKLLNTIEIPEPTRINAGAGGGLLVISAHKNAFVVDGKTGATTRLIEGLAEAWTIARDSAGRIYVGVRNPDNEVKIFGADGKPIGTIGRHGGRALLGPWTPDGMLFANGMAIDSAGKLWIAEADTAPKRISVWNTSDRRFVSEFFGPTSYGALGGVIDPVDPNRMAGQGCEWRLDAKTGRATCLGTISREKMENARYCMGSNGKLYLAVASNWLHNYGPLRIYERRGDADFVLRSEIFYADAQGNEIPLTRDGQHTNCRQTMIWSDRNGDGVRQPEELSGADGELRFSAWYMNIAPDLTLYAGDKQFRVTGFSACGAPQYDFSKPARMPAAGWGSADGRFVLQPGDYGVDHGTLNCFDIASGKQLWSYPDTYNGVHGSHNAPPPMLGLIRGSYGPCGSVKLPEPIGNIWALPTNVGEWHLLTERGFYLTRLFQPDPSKVALPESATPGAVMDNAPPGLGGEDFGGSITLGQDGKLYVQAGKTAYWNLEVTGLDSVRELPGGRIEINPADMEKAVAARAELLNPVTAARRMTVARKKPEFTGDFDSDFTGANSIKFGKGADTAVRAVATWDAENLYLAWDVADVSPWRNGADSAEELYLRGDTVDFQFGSDANAPKNRDEGMLGDLRLSIGNFKGSPTAVLYRKVAHDKHPHIFSSGVVKEYSMDSVTTLARARVSVKLFEKRYVVEAAIPLSDLEFKPEAGITYHGDFGVTHGDPAGQRTRLRSYWSNQHTGIVDDAVYELRMEPSHWGEIVFSQQ